MLIAGLVVFLLILGLFLQALTSGPKSEPEWQPDEPEWHPDTEEEVPTTPAHAEDNSGVVIA